MPTRHTSPIRAHLTLVCLLALSLSALGQERPNAQIGRAQTAVGRNGMVVAQEGLAARVGVDILKKGGNAVDAAVAVGFAMAVTYPRAGNLGGGGFMIIHRRNGRDVAIDYRETAPRAINDKSFLDAQGNADLQKSRFSALAIGVPGTVAGLALAERKYGSGRFTLAELIAPAIALARHGFPVADETIELPSNEPSRLLRWPSTVKIFFKADGAMFARGERLVQSDRAASLRAIARHGPRAFYGGPLARKIAVAVRQA